MFPVQRTVTGWMTGVSKGVCPSSLASRRIPDLDLYEDSPWMVGGRSIWFGIARISPWPVSGTQYVNRIPGHTTWGSA